ncbi:MAG: cupin domain-containing protein [Pseudonocardia sp.]|nr:cupin domain-containing protein [Pseudonocardia sp.]
MSVVRRADQRTVETPNAVMTTLASPSLGGASQSLWQTRMEPGQAGPLHRMDREQVWTVVEGGVGVEFDGASYDLGPGDTVVIPADSLRRIATERGASVLVTCPAGARAVLPDGTDRGVPDWIA